MQSPEGVREHAPPWDRSFEEIAYCGEDMKQFSEEPQTGGTRHELGDPNKARVALECLRTWNNRE